MGGKIEDLGNRVLGVDDGVSNWDRPSKCVPVLLIGDKIEDHGNIRRQNVTVILMYLSTFLLCIIFVTILIEFIMILIFYNIIFVEGSFLDGTLPNRERVWTMKLALESQTADNVTYVRPALSSPPHPEKVILQ